MFIWVFSIELNMSSLFFAKVSQCNLFIIHRVFPIIISRILSISSSTELIELIFPPNILPHMKYRFPTDNQIDKNIWFSLLKLDSKICPYPFILIISDLQVHPASNQKRNGWYMHKDIAHKDREQSSRRNEYARNQGETHKDDSLEHFSWI